MTTSTRCFRRRPGSGPRSVLAPMGERRARFLPPLAASMAAGLALLALACSGGGGEVPPVDATPVEAPSATPDIAAPAQISDAVTPSPPEAPGPATIGRIAYAALDGAVYVVDFGQGSATQISPPDSVTGVTGHYAWPAWSPDGKQVSFTGLLPIGDESIEITLMRASSAGDQIPVKVHIDDPASSGIAPGVPHYADWSPDTGSIALVTASKDGPEVVLRESEAGQFSQLLARGGPSYISWAPDSRHLLVHRAQSLFLVSVDEEGRGTSVDEIGSGSTAYRAPVWSPSGDAYIYVGNGPRGPEVLLGSVGSTKTRSLGSAANNMAFNWSPDGARLGILAGKTPIYESLSVVDMASGTNVLRLERPVISIWWSPDSQQIALAGPTALTGRVMEWSVLNVGTGEDMEVGLLVATREFAYAQTLFDQFALAHEVWSPDSRSLVLSGALLDRDNLPDDISTVDPGIWVVDASGKTDARLIAPGVVGFWSPG